MSDEFVQLRTSEKPKFPYIVLCSPPVNLIVFGGRRRKDVAGIDRVAVRECLDDESQLGVAVFQLLELINSSI